MISNWPVTTVISYRNTAATISQTMRKSANTRPTATLETTIAGGMWNGRQAITQAARSAASAAFQALCRPRARRKSSKSTGTAARAVESRQSASGS